MSFTTLPILLFCVFSITTGEFVIAGILPDVAADLGVTTGTAGLLVTSYAIGMIIGGPVLTALTARLPRKPLLLALLIVAVAGNLGSAIAPDFWILLGARLITALVTSTFFANAIVVAVSTAPPERAASTIARLAFGMNLAMIAGAPIGTGIGQLWGWRWTFGAIGLCCGVGLLLVGAMITTREETRSSARSELRVLGDRRVLAALAITALGSVGVLMVFTYLAPLLTEVAGYQPHRTPLLLLGFGLGATVGNLIGGQLADRWPRAGALALLALLAAVLGGSWFFATSVVPAAIIVFVVGALAFAIIPGMQARVLTAAAAAPTLALAVNASGYQVAAAVAGWTGGMIIDAGAGPRPLYLVAAASTVCGLILTAVVIRQSARAGRSPTSDASLPAGQSHPATTADQPTEAGRSGCR